MKITVFDGGWENTTDGQVIEFAKLSDLGEIFRECEEGPKNGRYWVRGELYPMERRNEHLAESELIVVDVDGADKGQPASGPKKAHLVLKQAGLSHIIYSSYSHKPGIDPRYRIIVQLNEPICAHELVAQTVSLVEMLTDLGVALTYTRESGVWSQPWFFPRCRNPEQYEFYAYVDGGMWKRVDCLPVDPAEPEYAPSKTWHDHCNGIITGRSYHPSLIALTMGMARDGVKPPMIHAFCSALLSVAPESERRSERESDLPRIIDGAMQHLQKEALRKKSDFELPKLHDPAEAEEIPLPPGLLGELVSEAYAMQHYPNRTVALISALGLVAGICGRKFNVSGSGLNLYAILAMPTGSGKDFISNFIASTLVDISPTNALYSFLARKRYTGPKAIFRQLKEARSCVSVMSEMGLMLTSTAGDASGVRRYLLDIYGKSGHGQVYTGEGYSSGDGDIGTLISPALTVVGESTPENLSAALQKSNSISDGFLPRCLLFRIEETRPYQVWTPQRRLSTLLRDRLCALAAECSAIQAADQYEVYDIGYDLDVIEEIKRFSAECTDIANVSEADFDAAMATRRWLKAMKLAALCAIVDSRTSISQADFQWAKSLTGYEAGQLGIFLTGSGMQTASFDLQVTANACVREIIRFLNGEKKLKRQLMQVTSDQRRQKGITHGQLSALIGRRRAVLALSDSPETRSSPVTGFQKVLRYMLEQSYIIKSPVNSSPGYVLQSQALEALE